MTRTLQSFNAAHSGPLADEIRKREPWFHNIRLPSGEETAPSHPLGDFPRYKWETLAPHIPEDLTDATVLDIGCNAGFYSLELARRGAKVFAIDHDERYLEQARWVARRFDLPRLIEFRRLGVYDLLRDQPKFPVAFDLVVFMGVLYHLRYPLLGLDIVATRCSGTLVFQTLTVPDGPEAFSNPHPPPPADLPFDQRRRLTDPDWPKLAFIEHRLAADPTNWWVANPACCEGMLRSAGFEITARAGGDIAICRRSPNAPDRFARADLDALRAVC